MLVPRATGHIHAQKIIRGSDTLTAVNHQADLFLLIQELTLMAHQFEDRRVPVFLLHGIQTIPFVTNPELIAVARMIPRKRRLEPQLVIDNVQAFHTLREMDRF